MRGKWGRDATADEIARHDANLIAWAERGIPVGGRKRGFSVNISDWPYPLICVCDEPQPEWVYVANQCAHCKRVIR